MARAKWTEQKISNLWEQGRGQGFGADYQPWLTVWDIPKNSRRHRVQSPRFGRELQLFSDVEYGVFLLAERCPSVTEAYEQYPIDRGLSQAVAERLEIRHPYYPTTRVPTVMTVDLLITVSRGDATVRIGLDAKTAGQLEDPRVLEKLQLTGACLQEMGCEHLIVCETHLPKTLIDNLRWLRSAYPHQREALPYADSIDEAADRLHEYLSRQRFGKAPFRTLCDEFDARMGWEPNMAMRAARLLILSHRLHVDLTQPDIPGLPAHAFRLDAPVARRALEVVK